MERGGGLACPSPSLFLAVIRPQGREMAGWWAFCSQGASVMRLETHHRGAWTSVGGQWERVQTVERQASLGWVEKCGEPGSSLTVPEPL